jgi:N-acetylglucosamine kinase-like BadF-type ATPase
MTFKTLPIAARQLKATEARLQSVYDAAKLGLNGDNLALAAGLLPVEFRRLREMDPLVEMAEQKGRADAEAELSKVLMAAALSGDHKAALEILKHKHDWVAKQQVQVDVAQQISILGALEAAERRVIDVQMNEVPNGHSERTSQSTAVSVNRAVRRV